MPPSARSLLLSIQKNPPVQSGRGRPKQRLSGPCCCGNQAVRLSAIVFTPPVAPQTHPIEQSLTFSCRRTPRCRVRKRKTRRQAHPSVGFSKVEGKEGPADLLNLRPLDRFAIPGRTDRCSTKSSAASCAPHASSTAFLGSHPPQSA